MKGEPDLPHFPDCVLVPIKRVPKGHPAFPKLDLKYMFVEDTYYRWDTKQKRVRCMVTVVQGTVTGETRLAWDTCGRCIHYFTMCTCRDGLTSPRSIEYIHDVYAAKAAGEEWGMSHPNYKGSLTRKEREDRLNSPQRFIMPDRPHTPTPRPERPAAGTTGPAKRLLRRQGSPVQEPRRLLRKTAPEQVPDPIRSMTDATMLGHAASAVDDMAAAITSNGGGKKLIRKTQPKSLIRRV